MICKAIYSSRMTTDGRIYARAELRADTLPDPMPLTGADIDGIADHIYLDDASRLNISETGEAYMLNGGNWYPIANAKAKGHLDISAPGVYDVSNYASVGVVPGAATDDPLINALGCGRHPEEDNTHPNMIGLFCNTTDDFTALMIFRHPETPQKMRITVGHLNSAVYGWIPKDKPPIRLSHLEGLYRDALNAGQLLVNEHLDNEKSYYWDKTAPADAGGGFVFFKPEPNMASAYLCSLKGYWPERVEMTGGPDSFQAILGSLQIGGKRPV